jgi:hypothetical protein
VDTLHRAAPCRRGDTKLKAGSTGRHRGPWSFHRFDSPLPGCTTKWWVHHHRVGMVTRSGCAHPQILIPGLLHPTAAALALGIVPGEREPPRGAAPGFCDGVVHRMHHPFAPDEAGARSTFALPGLPGMSIQRALERSQRRVLIAHAPVNASFGCPGSCSRAGSSVHLWFSLLSQCNVCTDRFGASTHAVR